MAVAAPAFVPHAAKSAVASSDSAMGLSLVIEESLTEPLPRRCRCIYVYLRGKTLFAPSAVAEPAVQHGHVRLCLVRFAVAVVFGEVFRGDHERMLVTEQLARDLGMFGAD